LTGDTVIFNWTDNGAGVTNWRLLVGTTPGERDLHEGAIVDGSVLSETVAGLPTDGSTVFVTLQWKFGSSPVEQAEYTFTAATPP